MARILEQRPEATAHVQVSSGPFDYPMPEVENLTLHNTADSFLAAAMGHVARSGFFWFAGEKSLASEVRKAVKDAGTSASDLYISGYWSQKATDA